MSIFMLNNCFNFKILQHSFTFFIERCDAALFNLCLVSIKWRSHCARMRTCPLWSHSKQWRRSHHADTRIRARRHCFRRVRLPQCERPFIVSLLLLPVMMAMFCI